MPRRKPHGAGRGASLSDLGAKAVPRAAWQRHAGPAWLLVLGAGLLLWSWGSRPDALIDFGRELYAPWQLAEGRVLYRDVSWFNGPLSPYVNSLLFRLTGPGLLPLLVFNVVVLAALVTAMTRLLSRVAGDAVAIAGATVYLAMFALGQYVGTANYNVLTPYSHELVHGALLATLGLLALHFACEAPHSGRLAVAGGLLGLVLLTKPEPALALGAASLVALPRALLGHPRPAVGLATWLVAACVPPVLAWLALAQAMPAGEAARGVAGAFWYLGEPALTASPFYRGLLGTLDLGANLTAMAWALGGALAFVGVAVAAALAPGVRSGSPILGVAAFGLWALAGHSLVELPGWMNAPRLLPVVAGVTALVTVLRLLRHGATPRRVLAAAASVFAVVFTAKIAFNVTLHHYGFVLAAPAALLLVVVGLGWLPAVVATRGGNAAVVRGAVAALLCVTALAHLRLQAWFLDQPHTTLGPPGDTFEALAPGTTVAEGVALVESHVPPGQPVAVMPAGVMVNWLTRRPSPTPYFNLMPPELVMFGEQRILASYAAARPEWVLWIDHDTSAYGVAGLGSGYGEAIMAWLQANYVAVAVRPPSGGPGLALLQARPSHPSAP